MVTMYTIFKLYIPDIWNSTVVTCVWKSYIWTPNDKAAVKTTPVKNSGLYILTHDLWDTSAMLYQLSYKAITSQLGVGHFVGL